jgi:heterodisulfide reductase subunit A2
MQAALDIANGHQQVYLVEREPSIGGRMAQIDRTFPTLDCSECILTPKMSDTGHHPFIELLSYSEVEEVSGSIGNFKVKVRKKARYVDEIKCVGCGDCEEACPRSAPSEYEMGMASQGNGLHSRLPRRFLMLPLSIRERRGPAKQPAKRRVRFT